MAHVWIHRAIVVGTAVITASPAGGQQSDASVEARERVVRGLEFLASKQNDDGSWTEKIGRKVHLEYRGQVGKHVGVTSLAALAFLAGAKEGPRGGAWERVERALDYVLDQVQENGYITSHGSRMYSHGFATLFLAKLYQRTKLDRVRPALSRAVNVIVRSQNQQGGWRYDPGATDADLSVTVGQLMALLAAREAGIEVPQTTVDRAIEYVKLSFLGRPTRGVFLYQHEDLPDGGRRRSRYTFSLTAAGVVALYGAGVDDAETISKGIQYLRDHRFRRRHAPNSFDYYYGMYYATQAVSQWGGGDWRAWRREVWPDLFLLQRADGSWQDLVGPHYATAMACIILQTAAASDSGSGKKR